VRRSRWHLAWHSMDLAPLVRQGHRVFVARVLLDHQDSYLVNVYIHVIEHERIVRPLTNLPPRPHRVAVAPDNRRSSYSRGATTALDAVAPR